MLIDRVQPPHGRQVRKDADLRGDQTVGSDRQVILRFQVDKAEQRNDKSRKYAGHQQGPLVERVNSGSCIKLSPERLQRRYTFLLAVGNTCEASTVRGRSLAGRLAKCCGERARLAEAYRQSDVRHRRRGFH
jgi:hypothetical protein